jgi:protein kinase-like protein/PEGA domain-containing protein
VKAPIQYGRYQLLDRVAVGGMAEVYRAKNWGVEGFQRIVAIKRILPNLVEDEAFLAMFIDEAKIAVQLTHPNIAQIFELGKVDKSYFIALEYVPGKDLRALWDRCQGKPMPVGQACFIVMKACEGLDYAHHKRDAQGRELGLVHRDMSPQNLLISYEGDVKIVDFGVAKAAGKIGRSQAGVLKGKFGYMSPEQVRGLAVDRRSDIFSLGVVLYELTTGKRLFLGESDFSTLERVRNVEVLPPLTLNPDLDEDLEELLLRVLSRNPEDRYQTAGELHEALLAYMQRSDNMCTRRELALWMKKMFPAEIEDEARRMREYAELPPSEEGEAPAEAPAREATPSGPLASVEITATPTYAGEPLEPGARGRRAWWAAAAALVVAAGVAAWLLFAPREPGELVVVVDPADAHLVLDDIDQGAGTRALRDIRPGAHRVSVQRDGYYPELRLVRLGSGERRRVQVGLRPMRGRIVVSEPAGARVRVDGDPLADPVPTSVEVPVGPHTVVVERDGFVPHTDRVQVTVQRPVDLSAILIPIEVAGEITSRPPARLYLMVDEQRQYVGKTPVLVTFDARRSYRIVLERPGCATVTQPVLFSGGHVAIDVQLRCE